MEFFHNSKNLTLLAFSYDSSVAITSGEVIDGSKWKSYQMANAVATEWYRPLHASGGYPMSR